MNTVLIVEDEPGLRAGLCAAVQTLNCRALSAPGLEVARRQLASESIDCVLLDIRLRDGDGLSLSKRRITLSTSGVVPMMARAAEEIGVNLAVSLHAVTKEVRDEIVPINRKYGIEELLSACAAYPGANNARRGNAR